MPGDLAKRLLEASELRGDFVLSSGARSAVYFDKFRFLTDPELLRVHSSHHSAELTTQVRTVNPWVLAWPSNCIVS